MDQMTAIWLGLMLVLLVVEALIPGLVSIWFAIGALAGLVASLCSAPVWLQAALFVVVSVLMLLFTRPLVQKYVNARVTPTNADAVIGKECVVTQTIDNVLGTGCAKVDGREWTARSCSDPEVIPKDSRAVVERIDGVKIIVRGIQKT